MFPQCILWIAIDFNLERFGPLTNGLHREQRESGHLNDTTVTNDMIMEGDNATRMTLSSFQEFQLTGTEPARKEAPKSYFTLLLGCIIFLNRWEKTHKTTEEKAILTQTAYSQQALWLKGLVVNGFQSHKSISQAWSPHGPTLHTMMSTNSERQKEQPVYGWQKRACARAQFFQGTIR